MWWVLTFIITVSFIRFQNARDKNVRSVNDCLVDITVGWAPLHVVSRKLGQTPKAHVRAEDANMIRVNFLLQILASFAGLY